MDEYKVIGKDSIRKDALEKVCGTANYTVDFYPKGMLYGKMLGSTIAHGYIKRIDTSKAEALPGVIAVCTGKDAPDKRTGYIEDRHILCRHKVRFVGDPVAAVAAITPEIADKALDLIEVEYEQIPAVFDAEEAFAENCPVVVHENLPGYETKEVPGLIYRFVESRPNVFIHRKIRHGDVEEGFKEADFIIENTYRVPLVHPCAMEPHSTVAAPDEDGNWTIWACEQGSMRMKYFICDMFKLDSSKVRFIIPYVGGGFGGKCEVMVTPIAVMLAMKAGRPVKVESTREEVFLHGNGRCQCILHIKDGVKKDGTVVAREITELVNGGAYSGHVTVMINSGAHGAVGTYRVPHFKVDAYGVHTNTPPTGPYRGLGAELMCFAVDCQMDRIADYLGIDKVEIRRKNLLVEGDIDCNGQLVENNASMQALERAAETINWGAPRRPAEGPWVYGKGIGMGNKFTQSGTTTVMFVKAHDDGVLELRHFQVEMGQGCNTVLAQIAAEEFNTTTDKIKIVFDDSALCPFDHGTFCSRGTFQNGNALRLACADLKKQLFARASEIMGIPASKLSTRNGTVYETENPDNVIPFNKLFNKGGWVPVTGELMGRGVYSNPKGYVEPETGQGKPVAYYSYGCLGVELGINVETGEMKIMQAAAWFDCGTVLNPIATKAQLEGAISMGIGQACFEETIFNAEGKLINPSFRDYKIPTMMDSPDNDTITVGLVGSPYSEGPYGAKGIGEVALAPVPPAVANAINDALGIQINDIPMTRERVFWAIQNKKKEMEAIQNA